ncbi:MAG: YebC/PmpR family DNA-binding transcriptional regulator [Bdellovibrionaceae bacterium]|nr:YebC/PmpR family DNA-binding transcriptional regulator [Pseudobdellovibrionaceae bacterium]
MGKSWKNPAKVANAAKKGAIFTKLAREIQVAAKMGGADPMYNARLRMAVEAAKKQACPNDTIDRAIKKGAGLLEGAMIEEVTYEGYGPHGVGVIVETQTDNRNRTVPSLRSIYKKAGGSLGESGAVAWMFDRVSLIEGTKPGSFDPDEEAIEAGANEVEKGDDGYHFYGAPDSLDEIRTALQGRGWTVSKAELSFKPKNITELSAEQKNEVIEFLNELDDDDDVHRVHATIRID